MAGTVLRRLDIILDFRITIQSKHDVQLAVYCYQCPMSMGKLHILPHHQQPEGLGIVNYLKHQCKMWNRVTYHGSQAAVNFQFLDSGSMQNINFYDDACTYLQVDGTMSKWPVYRFTNR